jgi:hypothetical protein
VTTGCIKNGFIEDMKPHTVDNSSNLRCQSHVKCMRFYVLTEVKMVDCGLLDCDPSGPARDHKCFGGTLHLRH